MSNSLTDVEAVWSGAKVVLQSNTERAALRVRLPQRLHKNLKLLAYLHNRSLNEIAVEAIETFLADPERKARLNEFERHTTNK